MTVERLRYPQWRKEFASAKYPFTDVATLAGKKATIGTAVFLPEDAFLDACFTPIGVKPPLWLTQITITHKEIVFYIGDVVQQKRAEAVFAYTQVTDLLRFNDDYGRPAGVVVCNPASLAVLQTWEPGDYIFTAEQTEFAATCCLPSPEIGVRGFITDDGELFAGDVWFVGGDGVVLTASKTTERRPAQQGGDRDIGLLRVDIVGDPLFKRKICGDDAVTKTYLQKLIVQSGCRRIVNYPDENGDFKITVGRHDPYNLSDTVLRVQVKDGKLHIYTVGEPLQDVR